VGNSNNRIVIAAAQTAPVRSYIDKNIENHLKLINRASEFGVDLIVFPEMSLTGYERELASSQTFSPNDIRLSTLKEKAVENNIAIVAGAPIVINSKLYIGSFIFSSEGNESIYIKKNLHPGEEIYFDCCSNHDPQFKLRDENISFAICYDIEVGSHPQHALEIGSTIYAASIFYSPDGMAGAYKKLSGYAKDYSFGVVMANFGGECWDMESGGQSAIWSDCGELVIKSDGNGESLIIAKKENDRWEGRVVEL
jgi:predicted amidohydrolase